jgi:hypothetical protein
MIAKCRNARDSHVDFVVILTHPRQATQATLLRFFIFDVACLACEASIEKGLQATQATL